jgi:hypothetical protein
MWDYNVTHKQLLLRSPRTSGESDNIDIVFWGVEYVSIPTILDAVVLDKVRMNELPEQPVLGDRDSTMTAFRFGNTTTIGFVLAAGCKVLVNQLEIFDSSLVYADRDRPKQEYGTVLAEL